MSGESYTIKDKNAEKNVVKECDLLTSQGPRGVEGGLERDDTFRQIFMHPFIIIVSQKNLSCDF